MRCYMLVLLVGLVTLISSTKGDSKKDCNVPTLLYDDLKCTPKYGSEDSGDCHPKEYDCSHIYNRPAGTCHLKGHFYKPGEAPDLELQASRCDHAHCTCAEGGVFDCIIPSDSCGEFWVPGWTKPGCYLKYELNRCCSSGQVCPPFDGNAKCEVNGVIYDEGKLFDHPTQKCTKCVCDKDFDKKLVAPTCQQRNCTVELLHSKQIHDHCAPFYRSLDSCCPDSWICPTEPSTHIPASTPPTDKDPKCKYGEKNILLGEKVEQEDKKFGKVSCMCVIPPFLTCTTAAS